MARIGLVLGAGGIVGQAYHAGVLAALEHHLGWDARDADVIVGTSAGSLCGALLRGGIGPEDLARYAVEAPMSPTAQALWDAVGEPPELAMPAPGRLLMRAPRPPALDLLARMATRPGSVKLGAAFSTMAPPGIVDLDPYLDVIRLLHPDGWPEQDLLICAVRCSDSRRVVFGRPGAPDVPVHRAVNASCAIPGVMKPVRIGGIDHVDGGAHSPTNADVLRGRGLDLVVVTSPMSAAPSAWRSSDAPLRALWHRRLRQEVARLRRDGVEVVRFEPTARDLKVMGANMMADDRTLDVVQQAFLSAGKRLAQPHVAERLARLDRIGRLRRHLRSVA